MLTHSAAALDISLLIEHLDPPETAPETQKGGS
jgi:hypothetical protein